MSYLDEGEISKPPELHRKGPPCQDLILVVRILLDVMNLIDWS